MTVLNETIFNPSIAASIIVALAISLAGGLIWMLVGYFVSDETKFAAIFGVCMGLIIAVILAFAGFCTLHERLGEKTIECIIDDDTPFKEIYDKYEIKDKKGDIYILEEKERSSEENGGGDNN